MRTYYLKIIIYNLLWIFITLFNFIIPLIIVFNDLSDLFKYYWIFLFIMYQAVGGYIVHKYITLRDDKK